MRVCVTSIVEGSKCLAPVTSNHATVVSLLQSPLRDDSLFNVPVKIKSQYLEFNQIATQIDPSLV